MSLLFETTDERRTGEVYVKSHVGVTWWTTLRIIRNYVERPIADTKTCLQYLTIITVDYTIFVTDLFYLSQYKQSWTNAYSWVKKIQ